MHPHILLENRQVGPIQLLSYQLLHSSLPKQANQASTHITINRQEAGARGPGGGVSYAVDKHGIGAQEVNDRTTCTAASQQYDVGRS